MVRTITLSAAVLAAATGSAAGHAEPSVNENNRYLKLTPLGDRVRLTYTIYIGEVPGAALRRRLDTDGDGQISSTEADVVGREIAAAVQPMVRLEIDGQATPWRWTSVDVGLGTPATRAGSFAIDLIGVACLPTRGEHDVVVRDGYALPLAGETELVIDAGLGVTVVWNRLGASPIAGDAVKLRGAGGPLAEGWAVRLAIGDAAPVGGEGCGAAAPAASRSRRPVIAAGAALALGLVAGVALGRWRRRRGTRGATRDPR